VLIKRGDVSGGRKGGITRGHTITMKKSLQTTTKREDGGSNLCPLVKREAQMEGSTAQEGGLKSEGGKKDGGVLSCNSKDSLGHFDGFNKNNIWKILQRR